MTPDEQLARAERALANTSVQQLFVRYRAIIGPAPNQMTALAASALDALRNANEPTPEQLQALEYAIRLMRPAPLVRHGVVDKLDPDTAGSFPAWESFSAMVRPILGAVGRIDRLATSGFDSDEVGTGFRVSAECFVTNRHVVDQLSMGTGRLAPRQAAVRFGQEFGVTPDPPSVPILGVVALHPEVDLAVLEIEPGHDNVAIPTAKISTETTNGRLVAAIGYPAKDPRNPLFVDAVFGAGNGVKRVAPGEVTAIRPDFFFHDCSTLGGNSGSPIVALEDARLVGVHAEGMFLARNRAVGAGVTIDFVRRSCGDLR